MHSTVVADSLAAHQPAPRLFTYAFSICSGGSRPGCGRHYDTHRWPFQDVEIVHTHGICPGCSELDRILNDDTPLLPALAGAHG